MVFCYDEIKVMLPVEVAWRKLIKRKDTMPSKNQIKKQKTGFTIIEVVLVLAIAGLIFLMVFVALPALQRSQRDTQRRDDMARFSSQLSQYQANNNGAVPTATKAGYDDFIANYLRAASDSFVDPSGVNYNAASVTVCENASSCTQKSVANDYTTGNIRIYTNATCNGESPSYSEGDRKIAFTYKLESAGIYCGHN